MDDPVSQLANYKLQLGQVEAALTADASNEELLTLRKDLLEIIEITGQIIEETKQQATWRVGMTVLAPFSDDSKMYEAYINEIDQTAGTAKVTFSQYGNSETVLISQLSKFEGTKTVRGSRWNKIEDAPKAPLPSTTMDDMANNVGINNKAAREKQRIEIEKRRKKAQKKKERLAAMDAAGERQKNSWQNFSTKMKKKKKVGVTTNSIFQTPKGNNGQVGVGTCGLGDRDMTSNPSQARYNARNLAPK